jgi:hypothetical protein
MVKYRSETLQRCSIIIEYMLMAYRQGQEESMLDEVLTDIHDLVTRCFLTMPEVEKDFVRLQIQISM